MNRLRPRLTYANVTATIALFIAISGAGAYAAGGLAPKSVGAPELRPGAVTSNKLRKNAVVTTKVDAGAITSRKLAEGAVNGRILAPDSVSTDKIAFQAITNEKVGPEAITGEQVVEASLSQVPSANTANSATTAESANPSAFAEVTEAGGVISQLSKGIGPGDVSQTAPGVYCLTVTGFNPRGAQASAKVNASDAVIANVVIGGTGSCPSPRVEVQTYNSAGGRVSARFYVVFYR